MTEKSTSQLAKNKVYESINVDSSPEIQKKALHKEAGLEIGQTDENMQDGRELAELYEESVREFQEGKVVRGEIVQIDEKYVLVDIGYKSEGRIPAAEFVDLNGKQSAGAGDKVDVFLERKENGSGLVVLSKKKAVRAAIWDEVEKVYKKNGTVRGKIISQVKGGFFVDIGLQAFLPGSQVDLRPVSDTDALLGSEHKFKILKLNKWRGNIVVSRRAILEAERKAIRKEMLERLDNGTVLTGKVTGVTNYGLFIDIGDIDGFIHITEMCWSRIGHPSEMHEIGDKVKVKVLNVDMKKDRVSLGIKQLTPDPWIKAEERYPVGNVFRGRVVGMKGYGAFLELEQGLEGLLHVSEMSWTRKTIHPSQILKVGDIADVMVLSIDTARRRIALGMKQIGPSPWDGIGEKYEPGTMVTGTVSGVTDFGVFLEIEEGIQGLIHVSEIPWGNGQNPLSRFQLHDVIQAKVVDVSEEDRKLRLSVRRLVENSAKETVSNTMEAPRYSANAWQG